MSEIQNRRVARMGGGAQAPDVGEEAEDVGERLCSSGKKLFVYLRRAIGHWKHVF